MAMVPEAAQYAVPSPCPPSLRALPCQRWSRCPACGSRPALVLPGLVGVRAFSLGLCLAGRRRLRRLTLIVVRAARRAAKTRTIVSRPSEAEQDAVIARKAKHDNLIRESVRRMSTEIPILASFLEAAGPEAQAAFFAQKPVVEAEEASRVVTQEVHALSQLNMLQQKLFRGGDGGQVCVLDAHLKEGSEEAYLALAVLGCAQDAGSCLACGLSIAKTAQGARKLAGEQVLQRVWQPQEPHQLGSKRAAEALVCFQGDLKDVSVVAMSPFGDSWGAVLTGKLRRDSFTCLAPVAASSARDAVAEVCENFLMELRRLLRVHADASDDPRTWTKMSQPSIRQHPDSAQPIVMDLAGLGSPEGEQLLNRVLGSEEARAARRKLLKEVQSLSKNRMAEQYAATEQMLLDDLEVGINAEADSPPKIEHRNWEVVPPEEDYRRQEVVGKLPVEKIRVDLNKALEETQVVIVSGGTGSGKTTQLPQFLVDDWREGSGTGALRRPPALVVTQPRRIAAVSIAQRVAWERNEDLGWGVGYSIRGDRVQAQAPDGTMEFVTVGTLLARVMNDPFLQRYSVIVLDEVHERDLMTDFLLILIKEILPKRPDLRLVLMSATLDVGTFARYFQCCQVLEVPSGSRFPVEEIYLDSSFFDDTKGASQLLRMEEQGRRDMDVTTAEEGQRKAQLVDQINEKRHQSSDYERRWQEFCDAELEGDYEPAKHEFSELLEFLSSEGFKAFAGRRRLQDIEDAEKAAAIVGDEGFDDDGHQQDVRSKRRSASLATGSMPWWGSDTNDFTYLEVAEALIRKVVPELLQAPLECADEGFGDTAVARGSLLCFLPGWGEIKNLAERLADCQDIWVLPLHSTLPQEEQQLVFEAPPEGQVKVILATSIAESSVTINDVTVVVDSGLIREMRYDAKRRLSAMDTVCASQSNAIQRKGRAGRVRRGKVFRLYSRAQFECLPWRSSPEMQRVDLSRTCLQAILLRREPREFLQAAPDAPHVADIEEAMWELASIDAIENGTPPLMTPLGEVIARMPLDPRLGRAVMMGAIFGLPKLTAMMLVVAGERTPFIMPAAKRNESLHKQRLFCNWSDTFSALRALQQWEQTAQERGIGCSRRWSNYNYVNQRKIMGLSRSAFQLLKDMQLSGLLGEDFSLDEEFQLQCPGNQFDGVASIFEDESFLGAGGGGFAESDQEEWLLALNDHDADYEDEPLLAGLLCSSFPGNLAKFQKLKGSSSWYRTRNMSRTILHKSSVNSHASASSPDDGEEPDPLEVPDEEYADSQPGNRPWLLYTDLTVSNSVGFLRNATVMEPWQVALFGGARASSRPTPEVLELDGWLQIRSNERSLDIAQALREEIKQAVMWQALAVTQDETAVNMLARAKIFFRFLRAMITGRQLSQEDIDLLESWELPAFEDSTAS
eukprot:TRINITY_DN14707_c0_g3_i1.p1 TRINITY_DN14707_c0_g3~~TRINITY_DN14707_c0_g3_i1.p1  ORF type:complete len:1410 (+),score=327.38 TRINITY_DN14707_c0_g3_i1:197-4426(+)